MSPPIGGVRAGYLSAGKDAIPDSAVAQYDVPQETAYSDADTLDPLTDFIGSFNASANGNPTYQTNVQNSKPVARYDGDDSHSVASASWTTLPQPATIIAVVVDAAQGASTEYIVTRASSADGDQTVQWFNNNWRINAGTGLEGSTTAAPLILTGIFDGADSRIRENGTQTNSGDAGARSLESLSIGELDGSTDGLVGDLGEVMFYDSDLEADGDLAAEEQRLADKWGITL